MIFKYLHKSSKIDEDKSILQIFNIRLNFVYKQLKCDNELF